ncbi:hypothetical protein TNCV_752101 [Trichonephila clavipes]|uniref:Uncharacterized protein n=1 Tax=Trichonephila clavipes TaxID=2585209 RepID=A0A8X7BI58_TRICX|nr:hypothetical protein TNCV_752101 [Trichonephila clavipes]
MKTRCVERLMHIKSVEARSPSLAECGSQEKGMPAKCRPLLLTVIRDYKVPSPIALVCMNCTSYFHSSRINPSVAKRSWSRVRDERCRVESKTFCTTEDPLFRAAVTRLFNLKDQ